MRITGIEIIPIRLPLTEPFVISYGTFPDVESALVRIETDAGITGWGEGTPDPHVTGETFGGTVETLKLIAPALLGLDPRDALRAVQLRACDLINIKLMKCGGLLAALQLNAIAETAGYVCQVGTMVESSIASSAGLHLAIALHNVQTVEMGGPIMLAEDIGSLRRHYDGDRVSVPDGPGLGVEPDEAVIARYAGQRTWIR